jgi:hypothetical protein
MLENLRASIKGDLRCIQHFNMLLELKRDSLQHEGLIFVEKLLKNGSGKIEIVVLGPIKFWCFKVFKRYYIKTKWTKALPLEII